MLVDVAHHDHDEEAAVRRRVELGVGEDRDATQARDLRGARVRLDALAAVPGGRGARASAPRRSRSRGSRCRAKFEGSRNGHGLAVGPAGVRPSGRLVHAGAPFH